MNIILETINKNLNIDYIQQIALNEFLHDVLECYSKIDFGITEENKLLFDPGKRSIYRLHIYNCHVEIRVFEFLASKKLKTYL